MLNRATSAKQKTEEAGVIENIKLAYQSAMIGKYTEGKTEQEIKQDMIADLRNTYSSVILNDDGTITIDGIIYEVDYSNGNANKKHNTLGIGNLDVVDSSGNAITGKLSVGTTAYIMFTVNNGTDIVVKDSDEIVISLQDGYYKKAITENGTYSFTVTGTVDGENITQTASKAVNDYSIIGATVKYEPTGIYNWNAEYATSYETGTTAYENANITLQTIATNGYLDKTNGKTNQDMSVRYWRILSFDEDTKKVQLVPKMINSNTVKLSGPQGYNNAVKLLNDACSELYSKNNGVEIDGITARSINIEDFEGKNGTTKGRTLLDSAITVDRTNYTDTDDPAESVKYGDTYTTQYTSSYNGTQFRNSSGEYIVHKYYPVIYEREVDNNINASVQVSEKIESGLSFSSQTQLIERDEGTTKSPREGAKIATIGIKPRLTNYGFNYLTFKEKFKEYGIGKSYSDILLPNGENSNYWVASRCTYLWAAYGFFEVRCINQGGLGATEMMRTAGNNQDTYNNCSLFPIVSVSDSLLTKAEDKECEYQVNIP